MDFKFSKHSIARINSRGISKEIILIVINQADSIYIQDESITVYTKLVEENSKSYTLQSICKPVKESSAGDNSIQNFKN